MSENDTRKKNQQRQRRAREEWLPALLQRYPDTFFEDPKLRKPLKIGIHKDILADPENGLAAYQLTSALRWYTNAFGYQLNLVEGAKRVDLSGAEVAEVSAADAAAAKDKADAIRVKIKEKRAEKAAEDRAERWMNKLSRLSGKA